MLFHGNNGWVNAPQCYVKRTLPVMFSFIYNIPSFILFFQNSNILFITWFQCLVSATRTNDLQLFFNFNLGGFRNPADLLWCAPVIIIIVITILFKDSVHVIWISINIIFQKSLQLSSWFHFACWFIFHILLDSGSVNSTKVSYTLIFVSY